MPWLRTTSAPHMASTNAERTFLRPAADAGLAGVGHDGSSIGDEPLEVVMAAKRPDFERQWAIVDSNHGPPPYQSGALTN
jgi:hypothetical protein